MRTRIFSKSQIKILLRDSGDILASKDIEKILKKLKPRRGKGFIFKTTGQTKDKFLAELLNVGHQMISLGVDYPELDKPLPISFLLDAGIHVLLSNGSIPKVETEVEKKFEPVENSDKVLDKLPGKFICLYGPNNLGKSTQVRRLVCETENFIREKDSYAGVVYLKYPIYGLESGKIIDKYLRTEKYDEEYSPKTIQKVYAQNRKDFQDALMKLLEDNFIVITEDYTGTGLSWGMTWGASPERLLKYNEGLISPHLAILFDGNRFRDGIEKGHKHEEADQKIWEKNRECHLYWAKKFGWKIINVNKSKKSSEPRGIEEIGNEVEELVNREIVK